VVNTKADVSLLAGAVPSRVWVRPGMLAEVGSILRSVVDNIATPLALLVTDDNVGPLYGRRVLDSLGDAGFRTAEHVIPPGEASKSVAVLTDVYGSLLNAAADREVVIVALGGGVVSDLAGFASATWMRGVCFAICPTTLEADVDASIGGKTAVNIPGGKNLVGAFHQPCVVAIDPACLQTLDPRDIRAGMAESIKHALITAEDFLVWHESHSAGVLALEDATVTELILRNVRLKADIVTRDAEERTGVRMRLNFGHTIGHAIEECCGYALRHGECVALGMLAACRLSERLGLLDAATVARVQRILEQFQLPTRLNPPIDTDRILTTMRVDKKSRGGRVQFVLLRAVGDPVIRSDIAESDVINAYQSLFH